MRKGGRRSGGPGNSNIATAIKGSRASSNHSSALPTPTTEATKDLIKESIKVDTSVTSAIPNPAQFDQLSPSVRDVAEHAAVLKSVLSRLGPIFDLVEREATRMEVVSPLLVAKDQVRHASVVTISDIKTLCRPGR